MPGVTPEYKAYVNSLRYDVITSKTINVEWEPSSILRLCVVFDFTDKRIEIYVCKRYP